jgi:hypothetical protein
MRARSINGRHIAQAQDNDRRKGIYVYRRVDKLLCCAEQEWSMDAQKRDVCRNDTALKRMRETIANVIIGDRNDSCGFRNAIDIEQRCERQSNPDGDRQIGKDGQGKGDQPDGDGREV